MEKHRSELIGKIMFYNWRNIEQKDFEVEIDGKPYYVRKSILKEYATRIYKLRAQIGGISLGIVICISLFLRGPNYYAYLLGLLALDIVVVLFLYYIVINFRVLPKELLEILQKK